MPRAVYCRSRLRAGTCCHSVTAARSKSGRVGDGSDAAANLPLRAVAECLPGDCAADDLGNAQPGQKLRHRFHHRAGGYGRSGREAAGLLRTRL
ncbi:hypothetical protein D3C72_1567400 [compost metagenome]